MIFYVTPHFSDVDSPIPAGGITITTSLRKGSQDGRYFEPYISKENDKTSDEKESNKSIESNKPKQLVKGHSADGQFSVKSSPLQSISSIEQNSLQYSGKNKEYFDNLQVCYDPENISISPTPLASKRG